MNQLQAFRDTLAFIEKHGRMERWEENSRGHHASIRPDHVEDMLLRVEADPGAFSPSKLGRWLGWAQCAATACGVLSLDEAKTINKANSTDEEEGISEFERGVRFVMMRRQTYNRGEGDPITQFGEYQMTMEPLPTATWHSGSAENHERTIKAILHLGKKRT